MDVLIKNINKPKNCILEEHLSDGTVIKHEVVELPEHGRLIDADAFADYFFKYLATCFPLMNMEKAREMVEAVKEAIKFAPTVLEAST